MKPYYEEEGITIYNADCLDVMKDMPDKSMDLVLTDPPYGIGFMYKEKEQTDNPKDYGDFISPFFKEMKRLSRKYVAMAQATKYMRYFWDWYKVRLSTGDMKSQGVLWILWVE